MNQKSQNPTDIVLQLIDSILEHSNAGNKIQATKHCATLQSILTSFPLILWNNQSIWKLAKVFLIMYHYDIYEQEDANITLMHEAYLFAHRSIDLFEQTTQNSETAQEHYFQALRTQILILKTGADCFTPIVSDLYAKKTGVMSTQETQIAQQLSHTALLIIQYTVLDKISEHFPDFNQDVFLEDLCASIEVEHAEISKASLVQTEKIHARMLYDIKKNFTHKYSLTKNT